MPLSSECRNPLQLTLVSCTIFIVSCRCRLFVIERYKESTDKNICLQKIKINDTTFMLLTSYHIQLTLTYANGALRRLR